MFAWELLYLSESTTRWPRVRQGHFRQVLRFFCSQGVFAVIALPCEPTLSRGVCGCDDTVTHDCDEQAISKAHNVNICFVMDTTGSMHSHMVAVKAQIHSIVDGVKRMGCRIAGLAFVSYKDWCDGADRVQVSGS
jgi:hypothetical protein